MKWFFAKLALFAAITLLAVRLLNGLVLEAGRLYKDDMSTLVEVKRLAVRDGTIPRPGGVARVLVLGDSKIHSGFVAGYFDQLAGGRTSSWNGSLPATPIGPLYFELKDYLRANPPPDFVILCLYWIDTGDYEYAFDTMACQGACFWDEIASYWWKRKNPAVVWNFLHPVRTYRTEAYRFVTKSLTDPADVARARAHKQALADQVLGHQGYSTFRRDPTFTGAEPSEDVPAEDRAHEADLPDDFDPFLDPFVRPFFDLTRARNLRVLLIEPPFRNGLFPPRAKVPGYYAILREQYPNVFQAATGWQRKLFPNRLFSDPVHLNPEGAREYTREVFREFKEVFGHQLGWQ